MNGVGGDKVIGLPSHPFMLTPSLILSDNSKVKFRPNHRNTFGLNFGLPKDGGTCVGATTGKGGCLDVRTGKKRETCYMAKITQIYKAVGEVLNKNTSLLVGKSYQEMVSVFTNTFQNFVDKNKKEHWFFRCTYSGDFFSKECAQAFVAACSKFPEVQFWLYTRSHQFVEILSTAPNVAVYLSADPANKKSAYEVYRKLDHRNNVGICIMGNDEKLDDIRFVTCPETSGKVSNKPENGACSRCRLCFTYNDKIKLRPIRFLIH